MCGRFSLASVEKVLVKRRYGVDVNQVEWAPRYNIAPKQQVLTVAEIEEKRKLVCMEWGLVPHWNKDKSNAFSVINARAESVAQKPMFRESFKHKRCLILADGFYEWKNKAPYRVIVKDESLFAFAGIWDGWENPDGSFFYSVAIITTEANGLLSSLHDRMPVILEGKAENKWLDPTMDGSDKLNLLFEPFPEEKMEMYPVSPLVNSWKNDCIDCIEPFQKN